MLKGVSQSLLTERKLADSPDLSVLQRMLAAAPLCSCFQLWICPTYRLQVLLDFRVQSTSLQSDDLGSGLGVVSDRGSALATEDTVDGLAGGTNTSPALGGTVDGEGGLGDDGDQGYNHRSLVSGIGIN